MAGSRWSVPFLSNFGAPLTTPLLSVFEALVKAFVGQGKTLEAAQAHIEELKEAERYILEVYVSFSSPRSSG